MLFVQNINQIYSLSIIVIENNFKIYYFVQSTTHVYCYKVDSILKLEKNDEKFLSYTNTLTAT